MGLLSPVGRRKPGRPGSSHPCSLPGPAWRAPADAMPTRASLLKRSPRGRRLFLVALLTALLLYLTASSIRGRLPTAAQLQQLRLRVHQVAVCNSEVRDRRVIL